MFLFSSRSLSVTVSSPRYLLLAAAPLRQSATPTSSSLSPGPSAATHLQSSCDVRLSCLHTLCHIVLAPLSSTLAWTDLLSMTPPASDRHVHNLPLPTTTSTSTLPGFCQFVPTTLLSEFPPSCHLWIPRCRIPSLLGTSVSLNILTSVYLLSSLSPNTPPKARYTLKDFQDDKKQTDFRDFKNQSLDYQISKSHEDKTATTAASTLVSLALILPASLYLEKRPAGNGIIAAQLETCAIQLLCGVKSFHFQVRVKAP